MGLYSNEVQKNSCFCLILKFFLVVIQHDAMFFLKKMKNFIAVNEKGRTFAAAKDVGVVKDGWRRPWRKFFDSLRPAQEGRRVSAERPCAGGGRRGPVGPAP